MVQRDWQWKMVCPHPKKQTNNNLKAKTHWTYLFSNHCGFNGLHTSYSSLLDEKTLYLTPEQEKDKSHFTDKEVRGSYSGLYPNKGAMRGQFIAIFNGSSGLII